MLHITGCAAKQVTPNSVGESSEVQSNSSIERVEMYHNLGNSPCRALLT